MVWELQVLLTDVGVKLFVILSSEGELSTEKSK
jgi:hypothetical protein